MERIIRLLFTIVFLPNVFYAQSTQERDSLATVSLNEVVVVGYNSNSVRQDAKILGSIDDYLSKSSKMNLVKRGGYAWEPIVNNMTTERTVITIDGMHIFGACTDKMDPVTSYVETNNLSEIQVYSGQEGNANGATIGGSVNLIRKKTDIEHVVPWNTVLYAGFENNGNQRILMGHSGYSSGKIYTDISASFRKSEPYKDGNQEVLKYSQFQKYNVSAILGTKISKSGLLEADIIYDRAIDIGYPALPMDVSLAEAIITSLSYTLSPENKWFSTWKTKIYYNTITHIMDDTTRPDTSIHMDMPGWSDTFGLFSQMESKVKNHFLQGRLTSYMNKSTAEMTMYPQDKNEALMFMYTWPKVQTIYSGFSLSDKIRLGNQNVLTLKSAYGVHYNYILSDKGYNTNKVFFPNMKRERVRYLPSLSISWKKFFDSFDATIGVGYGQRAPSVSEAYGFYLFNSFDGYDYIGNPNLENETSHEVNFALNYQHDNWKIHCGVNYFYIQDYIIGKILRGVSPMAPKSNGVRQYEGLDYANILNTELELTYTITRDWYWKTSLKYAMGQDDKENYLPLIQPFTYRNGIYFHNLKWYAELTSEGAIEQTKYSQEYGEDLTPAYIIFNVSGRYDVSFGKLNTTIQLGVENIFDRYYSTYSDWKNIPRKGRNFYIAMQYAF